MKNYFDKKGISSSKLVVLLFIIILFVLLIFFGINSPEEKIDKSSNEKLISYNSIETPDGVSKVDFLRNQQDGIFIKETNGVKTYYLGNGQFKDVIPSVFAQGSPPEGTLIDPPVYPEVMGSVCNIGGGQTCAFEGVTGNIHNGNIYVGYYHALGSWASRGYMGFPLTNISKNASINSATLFFYISATDYPASEAIEFRKNAYPSEIAILFANSSDVFLNTTNTDANRHYGLTTGTNVSTTGWRNLSLSSNALLDIQSNLGGYFGIGINGSNESGVVNGAGHIVTIPYSLNRSYIEITYTVGNGSSATVPDFYDAEITSGGAITTSGTTIEIGDPTPGSARVGFLTFNLTNIPDSATIDSTYLRFNVTEIAADGDWASTDILVVKNISSDFCVLSNFSLANVTIYRNITAGVNYGVVSSLGYGLADVWLGWNNGINDVQSSLSRDCITYGLNDNSPSEGRSILISSSEGSFAPQLSVIYTVSCTLVPASGDWTISSYCLINNQQSVVNGNLVIQNGGFFNMTGTTNITFSGTNRYIYVSSGGEINMYNTAGFNR